MTSRSFPPKSISTSLYPWELCGEKWMNETPSDSEVNRVKTVLWEIISNPSLVELETFFTE